MSRAERQEFVFNRAKRSLEIIALFKTAFRHIYSEPTKEHRCPDKSEISLDQGVVS